MSLFATAVPLRRRSRASASLILCGGTVIAVLGTVLVVLVTPGWSGDLTVLHALNHAVAALPFATIHAVLGPGLVEPALAAGLVVAWFAGGVRRFDTSRLRRRALLAASAIVATYAVCSLVRAGVHRPAPLLAVPLERFNDPNTWSALDALARTGGAFGSDVAAATAAACMIAFSIDRRFGLGYLALGLYATCVDVALGMQWPSDAVAGTIAGTFVGTLALLVAPKLRPGFDAILGWFARRPAVAYPAAFLLLGGLADGFVRLDALALIVATAAGGK